MCIGIYMGFQVQHVLKKKHWLSVLHYTASHFEKYKKNKYTVSASYRLLFVKADRKILYYVDIIIVNAETIHGGINPYYWGVKT